MQTERLKGFIPTIEFLDEMTQMFANQDFIACYGVYFDRKTCEERILSDIKHWQEYGFGPFYLRDKMLCSPIFNKNLKEYFQQNFV